MSESELTAAIGSTAARALIAAHGGRRLYIGAAPRADLIAAVGEAAALRLCRLAVGERIEIPTGAAGRRVQRLAEYESLMRAGLSIPEIAGRLGVSERAVYFARVRLRQSGKVFRSAAC